MTGEVMVRFQDQDELSGTVADLDLDSASFFLQGAGGERVLVSLSAVQLIELSKGAEPPASAALRRARIRLRDGEALDGYIAGEVERRTEAVVLTFYPLQPGLPSGRLCIPLGALKGVFFSEPPRPAA